LAGTNPVLAAAEKSSRNVVGQMCSPKSDDESFTKRPMKIPENSGLSSTYTQTGDLQRYKTLQTNLPKPIKKVMMVILSLFHRRHITIEGNDR